MRRTKLETMSAQLAEDFNEVMDAAVAGKFDVATRTEFDIIQMRKVTRRVDERPFSPKQLDWIAGFSEGYRRAMERVEQAALEDRS